jgi:hypothetical protein
VDELDRRIGADLDVHPELLEFLGCEPPFARRINAL